MKNWTFDDIPKQAYYHLGEMVVKDCISSNLFDGESLEEVTRDLRTMDHWNSIEEYNEVHGTDFIDVDEINGAIELSSVDGFVTT